MSTVLILLGLVVLAVMGVDVSWTVLAAGSGAGPLTARLSILAWRVALALGRREDRPRHGLLAVFGVAIVVAMLVSWVLVSYGAWWLVSSAAEGAVRVADTGQPASLVQRAAFVGHSLFTLGSSTYVAGDGVWQFLPVATGASGLVLLTLGISYIVPVASAVAERRQLAQYILSLGETPELVVVQAWDGTGLGSLAQHLVALTPMVHLAGERHLTYPALTYFHSAREHVSSSVSLATLDESLTLLRHGVDPAVAPDRASLETLWRSLDTYLDTVAGAFIPRDVDPLPAPDLQPLRDAGIPTVNDADYASALAGESHHRRLLAALLANDGWTTDVWDERRGRKIATGSRRG